MDGGRLPEPSSRAPVDQVRLPRVRRRAPSGCRTAMHAHGIGDSLNEDRADLRLHRSPVSSSPYPQAVLHELIQVSHAHSSHEVPPCAIKASDRPICVKRLGRTPPCNLSSARASVVNLPAMARSKNENGELTIMDLVHDPIITCPHPPLALAANKLNCGRRPWIDSQQLQSRLDAPARRRVQLAELLLRRRRKHDRVGHTRPRSTFTSSHGIGVTPVSRISSRASRAARMSLMSSASPTRRS